MASRQGLQGEESRLASSATGPDGGAAASIPFGGFPLIHSLGLNSVGRPGARGARP
jgi:hypothetical protein